jgi:hypothetical protein
VGEQKIKRQTKECMMCVREISKGKKQQKEKSMSGYQRLREREGTSFA